MKSTIDKRSSEFVPPQVAVCKHCGTKLNAVDFRILEPVFRNYAKMPEQKAVFMLAAECPFCREEIDRVAITALFMGVSKWGVYKSHVA